MFSLNNINLMDEIGYSAGWLDRIHLFSKKMLAMSEH